MTNNSTKDFSVLDCVRDLPVFMEGFHTPEESAQIIHAWCEAQGIEPYDAQNIGQKTPPARGAFFGT